MNGNLPVTSKHLKGPHRELIVRAAAGTAVEAIPISKPEIPEGSSRVIGVENLLQDFHMAFNISSAVFRNFTSPRPENRKRHVILVRSVWSIRLPVSGLHSLANSFLCNGLRKASGS